MDIFQIVIPLKSFELSTYHPYCSINRHIWTCFKFSLHQNPLNYQNIIRTAAYKNIFQVFTPLFCFELSKYHPYCIINGHKWSCFNFFTPLKSSKHHQNPFWNCSSSPTGTHLDRYRGTMKEKHILQWKLMELGGVPEKMEYFHWGPIFYVCSSARNLIFSMYKVI